MNVIHPRLTPITMIAAVLAAGVAIAEPSQAGEQRAVRVIQLPPVVVVGKRVAVIQLERVVVIAKRAAPAPTLVAQQRSVGGV